MTKKYAEFILGHKWMTVILSVLWIMAMGFGAQNLTFTNDYRVFFGEDNPQLMAFENLQDTYAKNDNVMFVLAPKNGEVFTREILSAVAWLTERAWETPYSTRVESLSNYQHTSAVEDDLLVEDLAYEPQNLTDDDLIRIRDIALNEPVLINRLVSSKAHVTGVNITIELPGVDPITENPEVVDFVRQLRSEFNAEFADIEVKLTGIIMMNQAFPEASQYDMSTLFPLMLLLFVVVLYFWVKGFSGTISTFIIIIFSIVGAMGMAGWFGIALTPPSFSAIMIIPTMAIADSVHVLMNYLLMMQKGETREEAMVDSIRINFQPVFLTSVTTAIGFMSMNFSDAPPFHDLGNIVAMGVMIAFVLSVTFLPAMMLLLPGRQRVGETASSRAMQRFAEFVIAKRSKLLVGMGLGCLLLISFVPQNELNDDFVKYFSEKIEFRRDADFASDNLSGLYLIDYSLESGQDGGVSDPGFQQNIEDFANWYRQQPEVIHVNVISDTFKRLNKSMHGDDQAWYRLPAERELAAQYLLLYEMSLPYGLDLNNQINIDKSATRMTVMLYNMTTRTVLELEQRAQQWLRDNVPPSMHNEGASPTIMFSNIGERNIKSMLLGTTVALVLISLILVFALRSFKIGLLSLIPNLIPAALAFGAWGIVVGQIGLALSVVTGMTLGIVVDDTVHFLSKYLRARREKGLHAQDAVRYAFSTVGLALVVTSIVLVAGFTVLTFSAFALNSNMAFMTAVTIIFAIVADFLLLPPILMALDSKSHSNSETGEQPITAFETKEQANV
ncbi:MAG: efflux RND transporter permease subunit [Gammaproteobacteria bacterium]|nr:efflux RND transporter permease subunit [Gammaproteobacteria bacterium]